MKISLMKITDPVKKAVKNVSNHPSIPKVKGHFLNSGPFAFQKVAPDAIDKEDRNLNPKKATTYENIPQNILKYNSDICVEPLTQDFNYCIDNSTFSDSLNARMSHLFVKMNQPITRLILGQ